MGLVYCNTVFSWWPWKACPFLRVGRRRWVWGRREVWGRGKHCQERRGRVWTKMHKGKIIFKKRIKQYSSWMLEKRILYSFFILFLFCTLTFLFFYTNLKIDFLSSSYFEYTEFIYYCFYLFIYFWVTHHFSFASEIRNSSWMISL